MAVLITVSFSLWRLYSPMRRECLHHYYHDYRKMQSVTIGSPAALHHLSDGSLREDVIWGPLGAGGMVQW